MMVSTILIGTAFATFWTATQSWEKARRRTEMLRLTEGVGDILTRQLQAIQPPFFSLNPAFVAINDEDELSDLDAIVFLSSANTRFPRQLATSDLCEMEFYIERGQTGEDSTAAAVESGAEATGETAAATASGGLYMRIDPTPDDNVEDGGYIVPLGELVTSLDFRFYDGFEWVEDWYYDYEVPEAIEFTIVVSDPEGLENPMSLTRLVLVSSAAMINSGLLGSGGQASENAEMGQTPEGAPAGQGSTSGGQSTGKSTGATGQSSGGGQ